MNFDSKSSQVQNEQSMLKLQAKSESQNTNDSLISFSQQNYDSDSSYKNSDFEESDVVQETVRSYAKQIPLSTIKQNLQIEIDFPEESSQRSIKINEQKILKNVTNTQNPKQNNFKKKDENENISQKQAKQSENISKNNNTSENIEQSSFCIKSITPRLGNFNQSKQLSTIFDDRDEYLNTLQNISTPRNDYFSNQNMITQSNQILMTSQNERSFVSQSSFYSYTLPYSTYDKEDSHSGYISYQNIRPKKSLVQSIKRLSQTFFSNTKQMYNETFLNRKRCQCNLNLGEGETCSLALSWLNSYYKNNNIVKMKEQYQSLLQMKDIYEKNKAQIDKDTLRTFPNSGLFSEGGELSQQLKNVLYAFSVYDIQVGYVQGMNFIVGVMLYHAEEYIAFWLTCMIFEQLEMRDIYLPELPGIKKHTYLIEFLMWKHIPFLHQIFLDNDIKVETICQSWIISLCGILMPIEQTTQFIDNLLTQGWSFFYRFIITYILFFEDEIIKQQDPADVVILLTSQSYQLNQMNNDQKVQWDQIMKSAQNIKVNESVIRELLEKYDIETNDFRKE